MILITGLICAINLYFVVTSIVSLNYLAYYIAISFVLLAYVAFVCYLVGSLYANLASSIAVVYPQIGFNSSRDYLIQTDKIVESIALNCS